MGTMRTRALRIVAAPDSFKGTLTAVEAAQAMAAGLRESCPGVDIVQRPLADGGEGTLACLQQNLGGRLQTTDVHSAPILYLLDGTAVLECASVLHASAFGRTPVLQRTSHALGELILHALDHGAKALIIALGGSATNDAGAGMLSALGARFLDRDGRPVEPIPADLGRIAKVNVSGLAPRLSHICITALCDVDNPLCGKIGATATYGPQKGVTPEQIRTLDTDIAHFARLLEDATGKDAADKPGAGAAGGLGYALALLGADLAPGAERLLQMTRLDEELAGADWLITGEGKSDAQTLRGKLPVVAARHARSQGLESILLSGSVDAVSRPALENVFDRIVACAPGPMDSQFARLRLEQAARLLRRNLARSSG